MFELKPPDGLAAGAWLVVATGLACPHSPKSSSALTVGLALLMEAPPKSDVLVVELPHPPPKSAAAVVFVVDVVGLESDHAFEEPHASKLEVRLMDGDLAAAGAGAGAGAGVGCGEERLNAELEYEDVAAGAAWLGAGAGAGAGVGSPPMRSKRSLFWVCGGRLFAGGAEDMKSLKPPNDGCFWV